MSKDEKEIPGGEAPKKSKKMLMIIVIAVLVLGGGGAGAFFMLKGDSAAAADEKPVKGAVVAMDSALTINLADGHYLKLAFTLPATEEAGEAEIDNAEAIDIAIDRYTGMKIAELETEKGRQAAKAELIEEVEKVYNADGAHIIMDIYFTQFVTQ
jgi:flagellar FliL protein